MIVPMKKVTLFALKPEKEAVLLALQKCGEFMAVPGEETQQPQETWSAQVQKTAANLHFVDEHGKKAGMFTPRPEVTYEQFLAAMPEAEQLNREAGELADALAAAHSHRAALETKAEQLQPWKDLDIPLDKLKPTRHACFFTGYIPQQQAEVFDPATVENAEITLLGEGPEGRAVMAACHKAYAAEVEAALQSAGMAGVSLEGFAGTAQQNIDRLNAETAGQDKEIADINARADDIAKKVTELRLLYDAQNASRERENTPLATTAATFYMRGWVRADKTEQVRAAVAGVTDDFEMSVEDPAEGEIPPTYTQNKPAVTPFEAVTNLYSLPSYNGMDPNAIMAPFYVLFFGMMLGDVGYGAVLSLLMLLYIKLMKPKGNTRKLMGVMFFGGLGTILAGFFYGSAFGASVPGVINVMKDTILLLGLTCLLGTIEILVGIVLRMKLQLQSGDILGGFTDNVSWILMIVGLPMLVLKGTLHTVGMVMAITGAVVVVLFSARDKKNPIVRVLLGLKGLYDITGYASDIVSYTRIAALGMSGGVIAMVINQLALMPSAGGSPIGYVITALILVVGHSFNLAISLLGAFVHTSRLQFVEFYGKFYQTGGRAFVPLSFNTKFVDVVKE